MKKYIVLVLLLLLIFSLTSCAVKYESPISNVKYVGAFETHGLIDVSEEAYQNVINILNNGEWSDFEGDYEHNYEFDTKKQRIHYDSESGTFVDVTNSLKLVLSEADKNEVNKNLGVTEITTYYQGDGFYVEIIDKQMPDIFVVSPTYKDNAEKWGETFHVITDEIDEWCIGDTVYVEFQTVERPVDTTKCIRVIPRKKLSPPNLYGKPIIYLYPEAPTVCSVKVDFDGELTCTYPEHGFDGWQNFVAHPDGTLVFSDGKEYYALYWEGKKNVKWDFSRGFCVSGEDTAEFLEWALAEQGLTRREANEFIVYWLPLMQENKYNVISFQTNAYTDDVKLEIARTPDSLLRVYMTYYAVDEKVNIEPQSFSNFTREGFTVVEWGGSCIENP